MKKLIIMGIVWAVSILVFAVFTFMPKGAENDEAKTVFVVKADIQSYMENLSPVLQEAIGSVSINWKFNPDYDEYVTETVLYLNKDGKVRTFEITRRMNKGLWPQEKDILPKGKVREVSF